MLDGSENETFKACEPACLASLSRGVLMPEKLTDVWVDELSEINVTIFDDAGIINKRQQAGLATYKIHVLYMRQKKPKLDRAVRLD